MPYAYGLPWSPWYFGPNPYFGGFGHFVTPSTGAGLAYPGFTWPFIPGANVIAPGL